MIKASYPRRGGFPVNGINGFRCSNGTTLLLYGMARLLETLGSPNKALALFQRAIKRSPQNRWLHLHASRLCLKKGQVDMAVTHWKKAAGPEDIGCFIYWLNKCNRMPAIQNKTPGRPGMLVRAVEPGGAVSAARKPFANPRGDTGLELLEQGDPGGALDVFYRELQTEKSDPGLLFNTGVALSKLNKHTEALVYYEKAQALGYNSLELLNNKGYSLFNLGCYEEAQTCYELARSLAPADYTIFNNLAACYLKTGQAAKACHHFTTAVEKNPGDALLVNNLAVSLEEYGDREKALEFYSRALSLCKNNPDYNTVLYNQIHCLCKLHRYQEALEACEHIRPDSEGSEYELWALRAEILHALGRTGEAADSYRKALGLAS